MIQTLVQVLISVAMASEGHGGEHGHVEIPPVLFYQILNFSILFVGLYFMLKNKVRTFFAERRSQFFEAYERAQKRKQEAERRKLETEERLSKLIANADESIKRAHVESEAMKEQMIREAEAIAKKLKVEAERSAGFEYERARNKLKLELVTSAVTVARKQIKSKLAESDQKRLNDEFVEKIQVLS